MSNEKTSLSQLSNKTLQELEEIKNRALEAKVQLEALKAQGGKAWTDERQEEYEELALSLVDIDEAIEAKQLNPDSPSEPSYTVPLKEHNMVHLLVVYGRRYNPNTGKEISKPYVQKFTRSEWNLFKDNLTRLGYTIKKVLHDPTGEAAKYVKP